MQRHVGLHSLSSGMTMSSQLVGNGPCLMKLCIDAVLGNLPQDGNPGACRGVESLIRRPGPCKAGPIGKLPCRPAPSVPHQLSTKEADAERLQGIQSPEGRLTSEWRLWAYQRR